MAVKFASGTSCDVNARTLPGVEPNVHYHKAYNYTAPYITNGFPASWSIPAPTETVFGRLAIFFNKRDVTYFRGGVVKVTNFGSREPFGDTALVVAFSTITGFDTLGVGDLDWLSDTEDDNFSSVDLYAVDGNGTISGNALWEGEAVEYSIEDDGLRVTCIGALYIADFIVRPPQFRETAIRHADLIRENLRIVGGRRSLRTREPVIEGNPTFSTTYTGDGSTLLNGFISRLLSEMVTSTDQWTLALDRPRQPVIRKKDLTTIHHTVTFGTPGVRMRVTSDKSQSINVIYGEGTDAAGTVWRNQFKLDSNITVYRPLAAEPEVEYYETNTYGTEFIKNVLFNEDKVRKEKWINFGSGVSLDDSIPVAETILDRDTSPGWTGTIQLESDPIENHRFRIVAGDNILVKRFQGQDVLFHISEVTHNPESLVSTLTVDSKARDANLVDALLTRRRQSKEDPSKNVKQTASSVVDDTKQPWDIWAGYGFIPWASHEEKDIDPRRNEGGSFSPPSTNPEYYVPVTANQWQIVKILASDRAQIERTQLHCYDIDGDYLPAAYVWGIWRAPIQIEDLPANPFLEGAVDITDSTDLPWWYFDVMILWGGFSQRCGYWPGLESRGSPKTGQMYDEGPWSLSLYTGRVIAYVAIYSDTTGYFRGRLVPSVT